MKTKQAWQFGSLLFVLISIFFIGVYAIITSNSLIAFFGSAYFILCSIFFFFKSRKIKK